MTTEVSIIITIILMVVLLASGMPIAIGLGIAGAVGVFLLQGIKGLALLPVSVYGHLNSFTLVAIPLFIFTAQVVLITELGSDLYTAAERWLSRLRGGLGVATVGTVTVFSAVSGSIIASCAGIGSVSVPEMLKRGYSPRLTAGCIGGSAGIDALIPPSIPFVLYGWLAGVSVGKLYVAGIVPGLIVAFGAATVIITWAKLRPSSALASAVDYSWRERWQSLVRVWPAIFLVVAILGLIYTGVCTATEAGATGAVTALAFGVLYYRNLTWEKFKACVSGTASIVCAMGAIMAGAMIFGHFIALAQLSDKVSVWISNLSVPPIMIIVAMNLLFFVLGCLVDTMVILLVFVPPLIGIVQNLGFDLIWFGVMVVFNIELAGITPPFGLSLFLIKAIAPEISLKDVILGNLPFVFAHTCVLAIIIAFPILSLWLPGTM